MSSDFPFPKDINKNNIYTSFDNKENNIYTYRIYSETEGTGTLGWVKYDLNCNVLYDISGDIGILPRILIFDRNKAERYRKSLNIEYQNCPEEKKTPLPFDYISWVNWQTDKDISIAVEDEERYFYYPIENNFRLNYYFNFGKEDSDIKAYKYFRLNCNKKFDCYVVETGYKGIATQYNLITVTDKDIISEVLIGDVREKTRLVFSIDENLSIKTRKEDIKYSPEEDRNIAVSTENVSSYLINDAGKIEEIE